jgi:hypothetical protein
MTGLTGALAAIYPGVAWPKLHGHVSQWLVQEKIPISEFYVTCATVIPVLFLAAAVQGGVYASLLQAAK